MHFRAIASVTAVSAIYVFRPGGYEEEVDLLLRGIPNTTVEYSVYDTNEYQNSKAGELFGIFRAYERNESDFSVIWVTPDERLLEIADYWNMNIQADFSIVQKLHANIWSGDLTRMFKLQEPYYSWTLVCMAWVAMMAALKLTTLDLAALFRRHPTRADRDWRSRRKTPEISLFYQLGHVLYQSVPFRVSPISTRIMSVCQQIFVLIFVCAIYGNTKTSFMLLSTNHIRNFAELAEQPSEIGAWISSSEHMIEELKNSDREDIRLLLKRTGKDVLVEQNLDEVKQNIRQIAEGRSIGVIDLMSLGLTLEFVDTVVPKDITFFVSTVEMPNIYAFATRKTLDPKKKAILRRRLGMLRDAGFWLYINFRMYGPVLPPGRVIRDLDEVYVETVRPLDIRSFYKTFIVWIIGLVLSVVCFILEKMVGAFVINRYFK